MQSACQPDHRTNRFVQRSPGGSSSSLRTDTSSTQPTSLHMQLPEITMEGCYDSQYCTRVLTSTTSYIQPRVSVSKFCVPSYLIDTLCCISVAAHVRRICMRGRSHKSRETLHGLEEDYTGRDQSAINLATRRRNGYCKTDRAH